MWFRTASQGVPRPGRFDPERAFQPWFLTIVARSALSAIRARGRRATVPMDEPGPDGTTPADRISDTPLDPDALQRLMDAEEALGKLPRSSAPSWPSAWTGIFRIPRSRARSTFPWAR